MNTYIHRESTDTRTKLGKDFFKKTEITVVICHRRDYQ